MTLLQYLWTNKYTPRKIIFTQPACPQIAKKFPPLYDYQSYISSFTTAPTSPYPQPDKYSPRSVIPQPSRSNLISFQLWLGLPSSLFPKAFPTKTLCAFFFSIMSHMPHPSHPQLRQTYAFRRSSSSYQQTS